MIRRIDPNRLVLGVTGSRAVEDRPEAVSWALARLDEHVSMMRRLADAQGRTFVAVTGDAKRGGDSFLRKAAQVNGFDVVVLGTDGMEEYLVHGVERAYHAPWVGGDLRDFRSLPFKERALTRNDEITRFERAHITIGCTAMLLAIIAPWSQTEGTQHTVSCARRNRVPVIPVVCPTFA